MSGNHLAISNVPIQEWGELYSEEEAMNIGTIFYDLNKPFFAAESVLVSKSPIAAGTENEAKTNEQSDREQLITKINQISFFLDDLTLYLDTHEKDMQAIQLYHEKLKDCTELKNQFAQEFYPLTRPCMTSCLDNGELKFCWQDGPMPWEGACV